MEKIELRLDEILKSLKSLTQDRDLDVQNSRVRIEAASDAASGYDMFSWWKWILVAILISVVLYYVVRPYFFPTKKVPLKPHPRSTNQTSGEHMAPVKSLEELINMKKKTIMAHNPSTSAHVIEEIHETDVPLKDDSMQDKHESSSD